MKLQYIITQSILKFGSLAYIINKSAQNSLDIKDIAIGGLAYILGETVSKMHDTSEIKNFGKYNYNWRLKNLIFKNKKK